VVFQSGREAFLSLSASFKLIINRGNSIGVGAIAFDNFVIFIPIFSVDVKDSFLLFINLH